MKFISAKGITMPTLSKYCLTLITLLSLNLPLMAKSIDTCDTTEKVIATEVQTISLSNYQIQKGKLTFVSCDSLGFMLNTELIHFLNVSQLSFKLYSDDMHTHQVYPITNETYSQFRFNSTETLYAELSGPLSEFEFINIAQYPIFLKISK